MSTAFLFVKWQIRQMPSCIEDIGLVSKDDSPMIISRSKNKRERSKVRSRKVAAAQSKLEFLFFDGRTDFTEIIERIRDKNHP